LLSDQTRGYIGRCTYVDRECVFVAWLELWRYGRVAFGAEGKANSSRSKKQTHSHFVLYKPQTK